MAPRAASSAVGRLPTHHPVSEPPVLLPIPLFLSPLPPQQQLPSAAHTYLALGLFAGGRTRGALASGAADMVLPRLQVSIAFGTEGKLCTVATLFAAATDVGRRPIMHLEAPQLSETAIAARVLRTRNTAWKQRVKYLQITAVTPRAS
eukprot:350318-Chlamydomonas_euryale.AAC.24